MKKIQYILFAVLLLLVACNTEEVTEQDVLVAEKEISTEEVEEATEVTEETIEQPEEEPLEETNVVEEEEPVEELEENIEQTETTVQELSTISTEEVKEIIESHIGIEETIVDFSFENGEIKTTIPLASDGLFPIEDIAVNRYSQLSDELLFYDGWETLTVTFTNVGTISMNRNEKETNEFGDYFPTLKIEEKLTY